MENILPILKGKSNGDYHCDFGLEPIMPSLDGPQDAYKVSLWRNKVLVFENIYSVTGFLLGHRDLFHIARHFKKAKRLVDLKVEEPEETDAFGWELKPWSLSVRVDTSWLECVMWGSTSRMVPAFAVTFYIQPVQKNGSNPISERIAVCIPCYVEDVVRFGGLLEQELLRAKEQRKELGIPAMWEV